MIILSNIAKLYDGSSAELSAVHAGVDLHLDKGLVQLIRPHDPAATTGDGRTVVDCGGMTVTPGLVDAHGHVTVLGLDGASMATMNEGSMLVWVEKILYTSLVDGGVTTMRDVGGATHIMKRLVDAGTMIGPRLRISICMLSTTGGHADFRGPDRCHGELSKLWPAGPGRPSSIVDGPWECRQRVREIAACGADLIKICASPGVASPGDHLEHREFTPEEIQAITDEAAHRGLRVAAHAHSQGGLELAIRHGVADLQHISFMDERLVDMAAEAGCTVTPTSWIITELLEAEGLSEFVMQKARQAAEAHAHATASARAGGLPILAGTDPVLPDMHGRNFMEIVALTREGLTELEAWHAMTGLAAEHCGQSDAGVLAPGRRADLLVCAEDVVDDPSALDRGALREVLKDGVAHRGGLPGLAPRTWSSASRAALREAWGLECAEG